MWGVVSLFFFKWDELSLTLGKSSSGGSLALRRPFRRRGGGGTLWLWSRRVDSRRSVSGAAARMGTTAARRQIRWPRFSSSRCSSLGGRRGIDGPLVSSCGQRGGSDHGMDFCPPASSLPRRRLLHHLREACEVEPGRGRRLLLWEEVCRGGVWFLSTRCARLARSGVDGARGESPAVGRSASRSISTEMVAIAARFCLRAWSSSCS
jgi:hypothetical protein